MHQAAGVRGVEGLGNLVGDVRRAARLDPALLPQHGAQVGPLDEPHRDVEDLGVLVDGVHRDHVRMLDLGGDLRLAFEASPEHGVPRELRRDDLERHRPLRPELPRPVHHAHPATAGECLNREAADLAARLDHKRVTPCGSRTSWSGLCATFRATPR